MKPFIRFPGGKAKHLDRILRFFKEEEKEYREPFIGGGSVYLGYHFPQAWINDIDPELYDLWRMVKEEPHTLVDLIDEHTRILDHHKDDKRIKEALALWKTIKSDTNNKLYPAGYRFLFLSKTCFSGIITGGPIGGIAQNGKYNLTSRWSKGKTIKMIYSAHEKLQDCKITLGSWEELVDAPGKDVALYLDPPYLEKGKQCYRYSFTLKDHEAFAQRVVACKHRWLVTIDDHPLIREIWMSHVPKKHIIPMTLMYSMNGERDENRDGKELFIMDEVSGKRTNWMNLCF